MTPTPKGLISLTALAAIALPCAASAQSYGSGGAAQFQAGYGGARYTTARPVTGSTRDANGNRLIVDGLIQTGASSYSSSSGGVATAYSGAGGQNNGQTQIGGQAGDMRPEPDPLHDAVDEQRLPDGGAPVGGRAHDRSHSTTRLLPESATASRSPRQSRPYGQQSVSAAT